MTHEWTIGEKIYMAMTMKFPLIIEFRDNKQVVTEEYKRKGSILHRSYEILQYINNMSDEEFYDIINSDIGMIVDRYHQDPAK